MFMRPKIEAEPGVTRFPSPLRRALDVVAIVTLGLVAFFSRRGSLPWDGLWFDDSWVAAGAIHGSMTNLMTVEPAHPSFTGLLMAVNRLGSGELHDLGVPSLAAGVAGVVLLYIALRSVGYGFSIAGLLSAAFAVAPIHILYSGRVKGYTFDTLWVLVLALVVPRLAARTWRWPLAVGWVAGAITIGAFSGYSLIATAAAAIMLVLHPMGDRAVRIAALLSQAAIQMLYFAVARSKVDVAELNEMLARKFDAHMAFSWSPVDLAHEVWRHLHRVAEVFPGGSGEWLALSVVLAICGLVVSAIKPRSRSESLVARFLLLLIVIAFFGSFFGQLPFGPSNAIVVSPGGRHMLWLVPSIAFGLGAVVHRARQRIASVAALRFSFDALAVAAAATIVIVGYRPALPALFPGSESATKFIEASMRDGDVVIVTNTSTFAHAASSSKEVDLVATPSHQIGFAPVFLDPRMYVLGEWAAQRGSDEGIRSRARHAERVFVHITEPPRLEHGPADRALGSLGFSKKTYQFEWNRVEVWQR